MQVSANIIRFPEAPAFSTGARTPNPEIPAEIVQFSPLTEDAPIDERAQQHGQFHVAHRIVTRLADQLEAIASL